MMEHSQTDDYDILVFDALVSVLLSVCVCVCLTEEYLCVLSVRALPTDVADFFDSMSLCELCVTLFCSYLSISL